MILAWIFVFLLGIILILGHVRLYERKLQIEEQQQELQELQLQLGNLKKTQQQYLLGLDTYAEKAGMYRPEPEEYIIVHVRGGMEP